MILDRKPLLDAVEKVVSISGRKASLPMLSNVLIELGNGGSKITATDLSTTAIARIDCTTEQATSFLVHGDAFHKLLKELDPGDVDISVNGTIEITQGMAKFTMAAQDPQGFPEITRTEDTGQSLTLSAATLRQILDRTAYVVTAGHNESRLALSGLCIECREGVLTAVATDGFRLALHRERREDKAELTRVIVPRQALQDLRGIVAKEGPVLIKRLTKQLLIITAEITFALGLIEAAFPDFEDIIAPRSREIISVEREVFLKGLKKVMTIASKEPVKVAMKEEDLLLAVQSEIGRAKETMKASFTGKGEISAHFPSKHLFDVFSRIVDETVLIEVSRTYGPCLFKGVNSADYLSVVMPVRMPDGRE